MRLDLFLVHLKFNSGYGETNASHHMVFEHGGSSSHYVLTNTISGSGNVSSLTDVAAGDFTIENN